MTRKWAICVMKSWLTLCVSFASSVYSAAIFVTAERFHVSDVVMILGVSLYVLGYAFGPLIWAPLGDAFGRTRPMWAAMLCFCIFQIPVGVAQNVQTILISRFLAGTFGSAMFALPAGIAVDILDPATRRLSTILFLGNVFFGPALGPVVGAFITESHLGWRWTAWIVLIVTGPSVALAYFVIPETYQPVLKKRHTRKLLGSADSVNQEVTSSQPQALTFNDFMAKYMKTPLHMLAVEPILAILTVYLSLVYGILYLTLEAFPISFQVERGWSAGVASLPFLGLLGGFIIACLLLVYSPTLMKLLRIPKRGPEDQLIPMMLGAILLPVGLFWFSGTCSPHINPAPQIISTVPMALSANSFVRSWFGFAFPLFAPAMYRNLGTPWATRLLGFLTVVLMPFPFIFRWYGMKVRGNSRYAFRYPGQGDAPSRKP
ncbi:hypothetical protein M409DRAFT_62363 [Zasmidium cellare ATCC 36951]|uniref:Major facilitator superfamily (MFS) profile domain-containing protein n=1 Tax=Zasmidium cellare ATCC 36951 TaxID=1080233 RepID=A0A6A6D4G1_ZASCE|nr:uncharacterized protein M409DRAFT_62363 [Zasmidium cellare ATCC 36951]KAF2174287.1 hypothetical protein M409DRAFT_62363 [Zasmidium cellare ATCC 36951]